MFVCVVLIQWAVVGVSARWRARWAALERWEDERGVETVEKCVIETSRVESFLAPSLLSIVLVVSP